MMLTVQIMMGRVVVDRRNGSSQSRYHGYTTGAHNSDAAIGHANASADASEDHAADFLLDRFELSHDTRFPLVDIH